MKKFRFSLDTVLDYKQQVLDSLRAEHGAILTQVREQERVVDGLEEEYRQEDGEFTRRKLEGITILEAMSYEQHLRALERAIQTEQRKLDALRIQGGAEADPGGGGQKGDRHYREAPGAQAGGLPQGGAEGGGAAY